MVNIAASREALATTYKGLGRYLGLCTGNPGSSTTPANEAAGGLYARLATTWGSVGDNGSAASVTGSAVAVSANAATYTYSPLCSAASGANMVDWAAIVSTILSAPGQVVLTPTYTQQ